LRASFAASLTHSAAHSASKCCRQNVSVTAMISLKTGRIPAGTFGACPGPDMPPLTPRVRFGADLTATIR
jgi:hypothetical protein